jgi:hypothetical protein
MIALRDTILAGTVFTLIFANSLNIAAQETTISTQESKKLADTFDQRYPANQVPTPEPAERTSPKRELPPALPPAEAPVRPSVEGTPAEASSDHAGNGPKQHRGDLAPAKKNVKTIAVRPTEARPSPSRVVVVARSFLDAGTEVLPGERKFLNYAFPRTHTVMDVVTNIGGRVGWHNSPLPGPLYPGPGAW